ncbi:MAG: peptide chain release factor N(5)-glutamine methyltransferase [Candidatus Omnitrophica bacterium]|nr:peptide chain release factor N(5)-glutamine methyltransferase [Candidatus Omnitrophota bacterium]
MKLKDWLDINKKVFFDRDLRFLVKSVFFDSLALAVYDNPSLNEEKLHCLNEIKNLYAQGMPLPYILGKEEFLGWEFEITSDVLIPRKETELIVEKAARLIKDNKLKTVLDLCTGSGNIGISLKRLSKDIKVFSSDISLSALKVTKNNIKSHKVKIGLINSDLFSAFKKNSFDLVISNPPYVSEELIRDSLKYEPRTALKAEDDGFSFIEEIIRDASGYLKKDGFIMLEVGYNHRERVELLVSFLGNFTIIEWIKDYSNHDRGVILQLKNNG